MNPTTLGVIGPGFLNQVPTLNPNPQKMTGCWLLLKAAGLRPGKEASQAKEAQNPHNNDSTDDNYHDTTTERKKNNHDKHQKNLTQTKL